MQRRRVLLVDDEEELVVTLVERLQLRGIEAEGVFSGAAALERMSEREFDVVVLDVKMPGLSGLDVMSRIKREHPNVQAILFTGHGSMENGETGMQEGAFDYLAKPVDIEDLLVKIDAAARL